LRKDFIIDHCIQNEVHWLQWAAFYSSKGKYQITTYSHTHIVPRLQNREVLQSPLSYDSQNAFSFTTTKIYTMIIKSTAFWDVMICKGEAPHQSGGIALHILNLSTTKLSMVSFMPLPLYPMGTAHWYPSNNRLGGPQCNLLNLPWIDPRFISHPDCGQTDCAVLCKVSELSSKISNQLPACFLYISCMSYSLTLKAVTLHYSEALHPCW
jgi:hypothetical protein